MPSSIDDLRVLIVADNPLARGGLTALLDGVEGLKIVAQTAPDVDFQPLYEVYRPDVVIWDTGYDPARAVEALSDARDERAPILALLANIDAPEKARALLMAGARGVLPQDTPARAMAAAAAAVSNSMVVLHPSLIAAAPPAVSDLKIKENIDLTARELEVLHLLAEGLPNKTIAIRLGISEHTVKFHINAILAKFGAQSRTEAVVRATRAGLIAL
jgi:DNA-binding NarL/FixJ family response regulator